jgi:hypothetical protein
MQVSDPTEPAPVEVNFDGDADADADADERSAAVQVHHQEASRDLASRQAAP